MFRKAGYDWQWYSGQEFPDQYPDFDDKIRSEMMDHFAIQYMNIDGNAADFEVRKQRWEKAVRFELNDFMTESELEDYIRKVEGGAYTITGCE